MGRPWFENAALRCAALDPTGSRPMSHRPTTVADLADFSVLIDARSPPSTRWTICPAPSTARCWTTKSGASWARLCADLGLRGAQDWRGDGARNIRAAPDELFRDKPKDWRRSSTAGGWHAQRQPVNWRCGWWAGMRNSWATKGLAGACDRNRLWSKGPAAAAARGVRPTGSAKTRVLQAPPRRASRCWTWKTGWHRARCWQCARRPQPTQKA